MIDRHIPAIDGLRAVSVAAVVVYHSQLAASGGFLAVSQFFTLSGFLVTSILLRRAADDDLNVVEFWGRRYRRLLPASMLTLAAVVLYGFTLASRQQVDALQESVPAAVFQVVNWHFIAADVSYVDQFSSPSPIQHFWSLAIEEQFYLVIPLLLLGLFKLRASPPVLLAITVVVSVASTAWMWRLFDSGAELNRIYFGTDTRLSEMLLGSALAIALTHWRPDLTARGRAVLGGLGAVAFAATTWAFFAMSLNDAELYRGGFLVYSALTCVVIYSLAEEVGPVHRLLAAAPLPAVGRLTYAIYLFHWPLMLVLTEDRVGVGGWWLLALQSAVTLLLAAISGQWFEGPIRYGRATAGDRRVPLAIVGAGLLIAGAALTLRWNDVETDLAGLGESPGAAPTIPNIGDQDQDQGEGAGPIRALLIGDTGGLDFFASDVEAVAAADEELDIVATLPFPCGLPTDAECGTWDSWRTAVDTHDPDVVLLHVSGWDRADVMARAGADDPTDWARTTLGDAVDVLTEHGAPVVWGRGQATMADALRDADDPFILAMSDLTSRRADMRRLGVATDASRLLADLTLYARAPEGSLPRVLVVGDSVSRTIGYGLERWSADNGTALVWSGGTEGCGVAMGGVFIDATGRDLAPPAACDSIVDGWQAQVAAFDPDLVVVVSNASDFRERRLADWPDALEPGDPTFDDFLVDEYVRAIDILGEGGASITWVVPACATDIFGVLTEADGGNAVENSRIRHIADDVLPRVGAARPTVEFFDLYSVMCPDDEPIVAAGGVDNLRPDGIHFGPAGSLWLAETIGADLLDGGRA